ncbi:MAG TPA: DUF2490 domain-containing protein [Bryobacteraceae bacterium]|nr:DUF2490 domain-containing protein [Bryobacteraceae bacterium]HPT26407.1 DUF2490 domain-containing protein [Bryobacteraceae bacterium]
MAAASVQLSFSALFQLSYTGLANRSGRAFVVFLLAAAPLCAQTGSAPYDKRQQWFIYSADHAVSSKWGFHFDGSWRQMNDALWNQWNIRPGVNYQLSRNVQLSAAYSYFNSHPEGLASTNRASPEHRLQEQIVVGQPAGKLALRHRFRFDQRFLGSGYEPGRERTWNLQERVRYMIRTDIPIKKAKDDRPVVYLGLYNEMFLRFGYAGHSTFDQNRIYAGLGFRPSKRYGIETGVFNQRFKPMAGGRLENNYVLVVTFINQMPLKELFRLRPHAALNSLTHGD